MQLASTIVLVTNINVISSNVIEQFSAAEVNVYVPWTIYVQTGHVKHNQHIHSLCVV